MSDSGRADGLEGTLDSASNSLGKRFVIAQLPRRGEALPERPSGALEHPLARHVIWLAVTAMKFVAVAFDGQAHIARTFQDHVDVIGYPVRTCGTTR